MFVKTLYNAQQNTIYSLSHTLIDTKCLSLSISLSLSDTHTHTHTHIIDILYILRSIKCLTGLMIHVLVMLSLTPLPIFAHTWVMKLWEGVKDLQLSSQQDLTVRLESSLWGENTPLPPPPLKANSS